MGYFVEHNRLNFGAMPKSIICLALTTGTESDSKLIDINISPSYIARSNSHQFSLKMAHSIATCYNTQITIQASCTVPLVTQCSIEYLVLAYELNHHH